MPEGGSDLSAEVALKSLFHPRPQLFDCYVGLIHFATQPGRLQRFEEAAKREHARIMAQVASWTWTVKAWAPDTLREMGEHLVVESQKTEEHLHVAVAAALMTLDRALSGRHIEAHTAEVRLPVEEPFKSSRYRLLGPPETPIEGWIKSADLPEIPRRGDDFEIDLATALDLRWRAFPLEPNPFQVTVSFESLPAQVAAQLRERVERKNLVVGLVSPLAGLAYDFKSYPRELHPTDGTPYRFQGLSCRPSTAEDDIDRVLKRCRELEVDVLVYPELTLDGDLLGHLKEQLRWHNTDGFPALVVAGSFHEPAESAGRYVNRSRVFDHLGEEILRHDKLKRFRLTPADIARIKDDDKRQALCEALGIDATKGGHERIEQGQSLRIVDGPLGRMITSICLDYCGRSLDAVAKRSRSNLFWVPTMSPSLEMFKGRAAELGAYCRATTVVANSEWLLEATGVEEKLRDGLRSLCYLPYRGGKSIPLAPVDGVASLRLFRVCEIIEAIGERHSIH